MTADSKVLEDAKQCNARLSKDLPPNVSKFREIKPRTRQIIELCNSGYTVDQIHERVRGTKTSIKECLKRHSQDIIDRGGVFYNIKISGKDFDRIMRSLESYKRNVSIEEYNKTVATQMKLRQFEKQFNFFV